MSLVGFFTFSSLILFIYLFSCLLVPVDLNEKLAYIKNSIIVTASQDGKTVTVRKHIKFSMSLITVLLLLIITWLSYSKWYTQRFFC